MRRRLLCAQNVPCAAAASVALLAGACVAPSRSRAAAVVEFEVAVRGGERVASFTASGGTALHVSAATPPVVVARPPVGSPRERLWVRGSTRGAATSCPLRVRCGGVEVQVELPATGHRDRFEWTPLELASADSLSGGEVELSLAEGSGSELWLDQLA